MLWFELDEHYNWCRSEDFGDENLIWAPEVHPDLKEGKIVSVLSDEKVLKLQQRFIKNDDLDDVGWYYLINLASTLGAQEGDWIKILSDKDGKLAIDYAFSSMAELPFPLAKCLGKTRGGLYLKGIQELDYRCAKMLSGHVGSIDLQGLETLTKGVARALAKHKGKLFLSGLKRLIPSIASELAKVKGDLHLESIDRISAKTVNELSGFKHCLLLDGIVELSDKAADSLARCQAELISLYSLTELSKQGRENLAWYPFELYVLYLGVDGSALKLLEDPPPILVKRVQNIQNRMKPKVAK